MEENKILIISRAFYPEISPRSFRATELSKELARQGHNVTVLIPNRDFDYKTFEKEHNLSIKSFVNGKIKKVKGRGIFKRINNFISVYFFSYPQIQYLKPLRKELKKYNGYDMLISIANPYSIHWAVALERDRNPELCNTWVADCGDPFMGNKEVKFTYAFYFQYIENWFCIKPEYLTVPIKEAKTAYPDFCRSKIRVIPQGFNFDNVRVLQKKNKNKIPTFAYTGALSRGFRNPSKMLEYLSTKKDTPFKFIMYTKSLHVIESHIDVLGDKLEIRDYVPREQLLEELSNMDFLVNIENKTNVQSPSKLIDYALLRLPIMSIKPFDENKQIIDEFLSGNYTNQFLIDNIEKYNISNTAKAFLQLMK